MTCRTKRSKNSRAQGRQNAFSGVKLAFLETYKDQFLESTDRGAFYTLVTKKFLERFGYTLSIEENPPVDDGSVDATGEDDPALQTVEEQERDNEHRNQIYRELREKLGCWFRYRYTSKNTNQSYINHIIERIMSSSTTRPRKKSAKKIYTDTNKARLNYDFNKQWEAVRDTLQSRDRIKAWAEFVQDRWNKESPAVRDAIIKQAENENATQLREWKQKAAFAGTPEDLEKAWNMSENILPPFADAMAEWLGANVVILAVAPLGASNGEIVIRSAQSDMSKGMTKKLVSEFDPEGWRKVQQTMLAHGNAYFAPEECRRRVVKNEDSSTELLDDDVHMDNAADALSASSLPTSSAATSLSASPAPLSSVVPDADATTPIDNQSYVPLLPLIDSVAKQSPSGDASKTVDGLYTFPVNSTVSWSNTCVPSLSQPVDVDDELDPFPLSFPFQPNFCATPTPMFNDPGSFATIAAQMAAAGTSSTVSTVPPSPTPPLISGFSKFETPSLETPSSGSPFLAMPSLVPPSLVPPSSVMPPLVALSSETPTSINPSLVPPSSAIPCSASQSTMNTVYIQPNHAHPVPGPVDTMTEGSPNGATTTPAGLPLVTTNLVNTLSANPTAKSAPFPHNPCGKENTKPVEVTTPVTKKRKGDVNSVKPQKKRAKEDNSMTVDVHAAPEDAPGEDITLEVAATRSGRKSNLPNHLKDAGYAPPKRNARKKND